MKKLLLLSVLSIVFCSCGKKDKSETGINDAVSCSISNDSVNTYLQSANHWSVEFYEMNGSAISGLTDSFEFIEANSSLDTIKTNSIKVQYFVGDCGKCIYVGNYNVSGQQIFSITSIAQNTFYFTKPYQNRIIKGVATRF